MRKPFYTTSASEDLAGILAFIARDKPQAAVDWVAKIEAKCRAIANAP
ncbi:hypothetical protein Q31b_08710 [Novipirellula aureliae]|uniref:Plasmid stabilization system protein n=1 Tax=Novipirellula aureliae TaxID=2527966 RepID=A0A5C6EAZ8_9BACT|nr:hypothetical protein Q31b_08710 [Novipirellula aureliae]